MLMEKILVNAAASNKHISPVDIRKVLASAKGKTSPSKLTSDMEINGALYRKITYRGSEHLRSHTASIVDRGANGGIAGNDVCLIPALSQSAHRTVNIMGIDNHQLVDVPLVTVGGVSTSYGG